MSAKISVPVLYDNSGQFLGVNGKLLTFSAYAVIKRTGVKKANGYGVPPSEAPMVDTIEVQDNQYGTLYVYLTLEEYNDAVARATSSGSGGNQNLDSVLTIGNRSSKTVRLTNGVDDTVILGGNQVGTQSGSSDPGGTGANGVVITTSDDGTENSIQFYSENGDVTLDADTSVTGAKVTLPAKTGVVVVDADLADYVPYTGATGPINVNNQQIKFVATPTSMQDATNKAYVDTFVQGLSPKTAVRVATANGVPLPTNTYNNGAGTITITATGVLVVDGVTLVLNDDVLVKDEADLTHNGIFRVTTEGAVGVQAVLTRRADADAGAELVSAYVITGTEGATTASKGYVQATPAPITIGTSNIVWNLFNSNTLAPGTGVRISGNTIYARASEGVAGGQTIKGGTNADDTLTLEGSISTDPRTTTAPAVIINSGGALGGSAGQQVHLLVPVSVSQTSGAGYVAYRIAVTESGLGSGTKNLFEILAGATGSTLKFSIGNDGSLLLADGAKIGIGNTSGTVIGSALSKLGFFGAPAVGPQTGDLSTAMANLGFGSGFTYPGGGSGSLVAIQVKNAGDTTYTVTPSAGVTTAVAIYVGPGGGGGGATATSGNVAIGGGGGSGSWGMVKFNVALASYSISVGSGGAGGVGGANGSAGSGPTSITVGGTTYSAYPGSGGTNSANSSSAKFAFGGGGGAIATNGNVNSGGQPGQNGIALSATSAASGAGGHTPWGAGGQSVGGNGGIVTLNGSGAIGFGGGGGGAVVYGVSSGTPRNGGAGANGVLIIFEYK